MYRNLLPWFLILLGIPFVLNGCAGHAGDDDTGDDDASDDDDTADDDDTTPDPCEAYEGWWSFSFSGDFQGSAEFVLEDEGFGNAAGEFVWNLGESFSPWGTGNGELSVAIDCETGDLDAGMYFADLMEVQAEGCEAYFTLCAGNATFTDPPISGDFTSDHGAGSWLLHWCGTSLGLGCSYTGQEAFTGSWSANPS